MTKISFKNNLILKNILFLKRTGFKKLMYLNKDVLKIKI